MELLEVVQFTSPSEYIKKPQQDLRKSKLDSQEKEKYEMLLEDLSKELGESMLSDEEMENGAVKEENPVKPEFSLVTEEDYMMMLERMQIVKEDADHPEFIFSHITLRDIINRTYPVKIRSQEEANALKRKRKKEKEELKSKKKKKTPTTSPKPSTPVSVISSQDSFLGMEVPVHQSLPLSVSNRNQSPEVHNKVQYQVPHSFFALLRKYFNIAMNHQLWVSELQERVSIWEKSPVSVLCPWRPLQLSWSKVVENTLYFLSLEEQGKVVRYLEEEDAWVWPDPMSVANDHLTMLFKRWLDLMLRVQPVVSPMACKDGTLVIPEPRMYTEYTVRSSSEEEIGQFQTQELQRFSEPQKPFTYCQHGYESVVGPVKGITPMDPLPASKGREHSLLISDRPSYVTILSLERIQMEQIMALRTKKASSKPKQGSQMRVAPLDYSADFTTSGSESSSPSFDLSNRSSPETPGVLALVFYLTVQGLT
ncbi:putative nuclear factor related to kappa-B-binding protein-like isoform X3 [Apostichopus japonicus]|uniref:Putative nuclear factor related to kappa-B-binding protein-like isoform X3 n=1 Tax=Stichopus japonicus TaxID=307972 RepID=A0A2G8LL76_STIJA|nr:putative nuclear factor related to kappa-B-binding protein-like isoform X3 [Apostichopus japonicus]